MILQFVDRQTDRPTDHTKQGRMRRVQESQGPRVLRTCMHVKYTCYITGNGLVVFATPKNPHFDPLLISE